MAHDILIIDDEADIRLQISGILEDEGFGTRQGASADAALEAMAARRPTLIILDVWLEGSRLDGIELLAELRKDAPEVPVIMISGHCLQRITGHLHKIILLQQVYGMMIMRHLVIT